MRLIEIPKMDYKRYGMIRDALFKKIPFTLLNQMFCNDTAYFFFLDESYIPKSLQKYIKRPLVMRDDPLDDEIKRALEFVLEDTCKIDPENGVRSK